jgi:hypothetical protein
VNENEKQLDPISLSMTESFTFVFSSFTIGLKLIYPLTGSEGEGGKNRSTIQQYLYAIQGLYV